MVFTTRYSGGRGGRDHLGYELRERNITQKNSRPNHPTTCGKVERFQQTMNKWLRRQPAQPRTIIELQALLDRFAVEYNTTRLHRSLPRSATPATLYTSADRSGDTHDRVRIDKVGRNGTVTLRVAGRLRQIGIGRTHAGTDIFLFVVLLVQDLDVRIVHAAAGEILRELVIDPSRDYQGTD